MVLGQHATAETCSLPSGLSGLDRLRELSVCGQGNQSQQRVKCLVISIFCHFVIWSHGTDSLHRSQSLLGGETMVQNLGLLEADFSGRKSRFNGSADGFTER